MWNLRRFFAKQLNIVTTPSENMQACAKTVSKNRLAVLNAVTEIEVPCNGRRIARHLGWDSACVTNRLSELRKRGQIKVAYSEKGLDGRWRRYYQVGRIS